jgi:hypothetical protein
MNSLKTLVIVTLLGAVGYGVYVSITRSPRQATDGGDAPAWTGSATKTQAPGPNATKPQLAGTTPGKAAPGSLNGMKLPPVPAEIAGPAAAIPGTAPPTARVIPPPGYPAVADTGAPAAGAPAVAVPPAGGSPVVATSAATGSAGALSGELAAKFGTFMQSVQGQLDENKLDEALHALSEVYLKIPDLPPAESKQIIQLLDQLAGTVIYSRQHLLEKPYTVEPGDTLDQIAQKYNVPWELLARINGIRDPRNLTPGKQLKVVRGPFRAEVSLAKGEMTLMLGDRYAGRFPLAVNRDQAPAPGQYAVGKVAAADPQTGLPAYIDLGNQTGIIGYPKDATQADPRVPLGLNYRDFEDVSGILSLGSRVVIQR